MIEVDRLRKAWDSGDMELRRWQVGDATVFRIADVDATAALQGLIPKFSPAAVSRVAWLTPDFVDEMGRLRGMVQAFLIMISGRRSSSIRASVWKETYCGSRLGQHAHGFSRTVAGRRRGAERNRSCGQYASAL